MKNTYPIGTSEDRQAFVSAMMETGTHRFSNPENTNYTFCITQFMDGWNQTGESVCVDSADYNPAIGQKIAQDNAYVVAENHYWQVSGYLAMIGQKEITFETSSNTK